MHHAPERKSIAQKQFAYNKLKTEKQQNQPSAMAKVKPARPPQPVVTNSNKEGILIDLGEGFSTQNGVTALARPQPMHMSSMPSILDAPIDVPTEYMAESMETIKMEPPPYHSPPTYSNTYNLNHHSDQYSGNIFPNDSSMSNSLDPFDTSYLGAQSQSPVFHRYGANIDQSPPTHNGLNGGAHGGAVSKKTQLTNQLDAIVMNTMASMSPRNSMRNLSTSFNEPNKSNLNAIYGNTRNQSNYSSDLDLSSLSLAAASSQTQDESLSDSMRVNLSTRTLDEVLANTTNTSNNSMLSTPPKRLDKSFYADLEKNIYKNEQTANSLLQNTAQTYANSSAHKENTVSTMPSEIYERRSMADQQYASTNDPMRLNKVQNTTARPQKFVNQSKSINQELVQRSSNYDSTSIYQNNIAAKLQKQLNTETQGAVGFTNNASSLDSTNHVINQIWFEQQAAALSATTKPENSGPTTNSWQLPTITAPTTNHNFVAISNRPVSVMSETPRYDLYSSVAGDIYGSLAGDRYESVAGSVYGSIPFNSAAYGVSSTIPSMQPVLYDEVCCLGINRKTERHSFI